MADRYWVGGTGNWNDTNRWSTTSGGAGGASVPTSADNAYFDGASDTGAAFTVTVNATANCNNFIVGDGVTVTALDQTMTLAGSSTLNIFGSLYLPTTLWARTYSGSIVFSATTTGKTITTNGNHLTSNTYNFNGIGGEWTLQNALSLGNIYWRVDNGTFNTGNYNISCGNSSIAWFGGTINLGSSTITFGGATPSGNSFDVTNAIVNAGTSKIIFTFFPAFNGGGKIYYNIEVTATEHFFLRGENTFNNVTISPRTSVTRFPIYINANQTINGTFTAQSGVTNPTFRIFIFSETFGTARTLTCNAITIGNGVDFRDITIAGAAAPFDASTTLTGDCGGNLGITFPAPKTVYWNLAGSQNWSATAWATTSTGTPAVANFPLAQDTAVITEAGVAGTITTNLAWSIGTITFDDGVSPRTSAVTLTLSNSPIIHGDLKLSSGVVIAGTSTLTFSGRKTQNITSVSKIFSTPITIESPGGSLVLQDNLTLGSTLTFTLTRGTLDLNTNKVLSTGIFSSSNSNTRSIAFGTSGKIQCTGNATAVFGMATANNFTFTGTSNIELNYTGSVGTRIIGFGETSGSTEANSLNVRVLNGFDKIYTNYSAVRSSFRNLIFDDAFNGTWGVTGNAAAIYPIICYGNLSLSQNMLFELNNSADLTFNSASATQTFTTKNKTWPTRIEKNGAGTLRLEDNLTMYSGSSRFVHTLGTVNLNGRVLTTDFYSSSNTNVRSIQFGAGEIIIAGAGTHPTFGGNVWDINGSNMTVIPGTGKITLSNTSATARTFAGGGVQGYPELVIGGATGASTLTITGANRFTKLTNAKGVAYSIVFPNATTRFDQWALDGSSGNVITMTRTGGSGEFTLEYMGNQYIVAKYISISNSLFQPTNRGYAINSTSGGGNNGWIFGAPPFGKFLTFFAPPL